MYHIPTSILTPAQKREMILLLLLAIIISCIETVGISAILPFISLANDFDLVRSNEYYNYVYTFFNCTSEKNFIIFFGAVLIAFYFVRGFMNLAYAYLIQKFGKYIFHTSASKLFSNYMHIRYQDMLKRNSSDLTQNMVTEALYAGNYYNALLLLISELLVTTLIYGTLLFINYKATLAVTVFLALMVIILVKTISPLIEKEGDKRNDYQQKFYRIINEAFGNLKTIKLLSCEKATINSLWVTSRGLADAFVMSNAYISIPRLSLEFIGFSMLISAMIGALYFNLNIQQIIPMLTLYALAMYRLLPSANKIMSSYNNMIFYNKSLETVNKDYHMDIHKLGDDPVNFNGSLTLKDISFGYDKNLVLENVNMTIRKGEKIAFIGESGAGKSTLADIIIGMYTSFTGEIMVDKTKLSKANLLSWRSKIGYIPQEIYLFDSSIADNVAFGRELDEQKVKAALEKAELTDFINKHEGINTQVGEGGALLSGGQKQRIAIARAIYGNPDLLVLDEATSALDKKTEERIMQHIFNVCEGKTLIIIAHRLSTIEKCDKTFVIKNKTAFKHRSNRDMGEDHG
ncbi:ATP-binding cassette domain-containing protein [Maridesulfovibrio sp.]|uniref:ABC transporter ATP-binding protein n=1 Tax=Maridesulfovibrio sp. TaxID=2795000 RepID=UPI0029CA0CB9|nr:ATP-binding cassette domain-containing protein [Maridesulfovibrio sp.]